MGTRMHTHHVGAVHTFVVKLFQNAACGSKGMARDQWCRGNTLLVYDGSNPVVRTLQESGGEGAGELCARK